MTNEDKGQMTAQEVMEKAAADPTLDEVMRREVPEISDAELRRIVESERAKRALFIQTQEKKKGKDDE